MKDIKPKREVKIKKTTSSSSLYDDALPAKLQYEGVVNKPESKIKITTSKNQSLSPYIIHLAGEEAEVQGEKSGIESLAEQIMISSEDFSENLPEFEENSLEVDFQDLIAQIQEPESQFSKNTKINSTEKFKKERSVSAPATLIGKTIEKQEVIDLLFKDEEETEKEILDTEPTFGTIKISYQKIKVEEALEEKVALVVTEKAPKKLLLPSFTFNFSFPKFAQAHHQAFATFILFAFAIILPLHAMQGASSLTDNKTLITENSLQAINNLSKGGSALQNNKYEAAGADFDRAINNFSKAEESLESMNFVVLAIARILPQTESTYKSVRGLLGVGKELSKAASKLSKAASEINSQSSDNIVTKLNLLQAYTKSALPEIQAAELLLKDVDPNVIPAEYSEQIKTLKEKVPALSKTMEEFIEFSDTLSTVLGQNQKMRYLLIFQNNTELRPTGGFIGSFAEVDILNGKIESINVPEGGTYDLQGQLTEFVAPPKPLSLVNPRWEFHDANWSPDFPTSAKKLIWFYENAGGPTVDGVIAVNATFMPKLLEITGPIEMPEYDRIIDSENFLFETQKIVEFEFEDYKTESERTVEAPKKFLGDLTPKILERLEKSEMDGMLAVLDLIGTGLYQKDIQMFFKENELQSKIKQLGWSGEIKQTSGDFLMVTHTNLGGGKTDTVINQDIYIDTEIKEDGSVYNTVTIVKEHKGLKSAIFEGLNNVDYIRIYVPKGSELLEASGFEIPPEDLFKVSDIPLNFDEDLALIESNHRKDVKSGTDIWSEHGKTVFGNWIQTKPGEIETIKFKYKLPFTFLPPDNEKTLFEIVKSKLGLKDLENYTLFIQKQPGVITRRTTSTLLLPDSKKVIWSSHNSRSGDGVTIDNSKDEFIRYLIETPNVYDN